jgi:hypothetical protein
MEGTAAAQSVKGIVKKSSPYRTSTSDPHEKHSTLDYHISIRFQQKTMPRSDSAVHNISLACVSLYTLIYYDYDDMQTFVYCVTSSR